MQTAKCPSCENTFSEANVKIIPVIDAQGVEFKAIMICCSGCETVLGTQLNQFDIEGRKSP